MEQEKPYQKVLNKVLEIIAIPKEYVLKNVRSEKQNDADVWVFRYEKQHGTLVKRSKQNQ